MCMKFRISDLAQFANCQFRSKLQATKQVAKPRNSNPMSVGREMHFQYSLPYKDFDRRLLRYKLSTIGKSFKRKLDGHIITGRPDDYRILLHHEKKKVVSIIEVKTTSKRNLWINERYAGIFQVQLYAWLMEPILEELGYEIHCRHYLEIYSQKDKHLIERMAIHCNPKMEDVLRQIFKAYNGQARIKFPPQWVCRNCPRQVKESCWRWEAIKS